MIANDAFVIFIAFSLCVGICIGVAIPGRLLCAEDAQIKPRQEIEVAVDYGTKASRFIATVTQSGLVADCYGDLFLLLPGGKTKCGRDWFPLKNCPLEYVG